jgi:hypothetical protein
MKLIGLAIGCVLCVSGCATESPAYRSQRTFENPDAAVGSLLAAARSDDADELHAIFGDEADAILSSGDPVMDRRALEVFGVAMDQAWSLESVNRREKELVVGDEEWPFPIPLVKDSRGWWFDTEAGEVEVLARRIGRNELAVIGILRTYADAQREYASEGHDGRPAGIYAQRFRSTPGRHDGLYWPEEAPDAPPSPLSALAAEAAEEGYERDPNRGPTPFHGYYFRILTRQGPDAPGGASDYIVNGDMTAGFGAIAYPAEYGNSGIMTFIVGPDAVVFESDLGEETSRIAGEVDAFDPGDGWHEVDEE